MRRGLPPGVAHAGHAEGANQFLSYASEDRGPAAALAPLLEARGWCVWWDRQIFIIGEAFDTAIERELENAKGQYYRDVIADSAGPIP